MTIDEAIQHCKEVAAENTEESGYDECKAKLLQLVDWLEELKTLRIRCSVLSDVHIKCEAMLKEIHGKMETEIANQELALRDLMMDNSLNVC